MEENIRADRSTFLPCTSCEAGAADGKIALSDTNVQGLVMTFLPAVPTLLELERDKFFYTNYCVHKT